MIPTPFRPAPEPFPLPTTAKQNHKSNWLWRSEDGQPLWVKPECIDEDGIVHCTPLVCSECQLKAANVEQNTNDINGLLVVGALLGAVGLLAWYGSKPAQTPLPVQSPPPYPPQVQVPRQ